MVRSKGDVVCLVIISGLMMTKLSVTAEAKLEFDNTMVVEKVAQDESSPFSLIMYCTYM